MLDALLLLVFAIVLILYILGSLYGGTRFMASVFERLDTDTKQGVLLMIVLFVPVTFIALAFGPFIALWYATKTFRAMPWK